MRRQEEMIKKVLFAKSNGRLRECAAGCKGEEDEDRGAGSESDLSLQAAVGNATEGGDGRVPIFVPPNVLCLGP